MSGVLRKDFIERKLASVVSIPSGWEVDPTGNYYSLDLKMCQLRDLYYDFEWGKEVGPLPRLASITDSPSRILKVDISMNELLFLHPEGLAPFRNLRELDASLNKISRFPGLELLGQLRYLNLSHNFISRVEEIVSSSTLVVLNLSMNDIEDMTMMPSMVNLKILIVNNNKLRSLNGVQSLPRLQELYAQRNQITDLVAVSSCFHLRVLNASDNKIVAFQNVLDVLSKLYNLDVLNLHGNPIDRERHYQSDLLNAVGSLVTLDNITLKPLPSIVMEGSQHADNIYTLKDAAIQAFEERIRMSKARTDDNVMFLQKRILAIQDEHQKFADKMRRELDVCVRYLDSLSAAGAQNVDLDSLRTTIGTPYPKPWLDSYRSPRHRHRDYTGIKDTDEVLKCAFTELTLSKLDQV